MPLTTYTAGDVLTAASLNANFTFAAANPPEALVRVGGGTLSGASTIFDDVFSSNNKFYLITISNAESSATANLFFQFRFAGPTTENTGYFAGLFGVSSAAVTSTSGTNNGSSGTVCLVDGGTLFGQLQVSGMDSAGSRSRFAGQFSSSRGNGFFVGGGENSVSRVHTGFVLGVSSGTLTGTVNIYGYALS